MSFIGPITAVVTFLIIGLFHPIVIKCEYRWGTRCWTIFLFLGLLFIIGSLLVRAILLSIILGVVGCSCMWSILELFEQHKRVEKGWFPMNPQRQSDYHKQKET